MSNWVWSDLIADTAWAGGWAADLEGPFHPALCYGASLGCGAVESSIRHQVVWKGGFFFSGLFLVFLTFLISFESLQELISVALLCVKVKSGDPNLREAGKSEAISVALLPL